MITGPVGQLRIVALLHGVETPHSRSPSMRQQQVCRTSAAEPHSPHRSGPLISDGRRGLIPTKRARDRPRLAPPAPPPQCGSPHAPGGGCDIFGCSVPLANALYGASSRTRNRARNSEIAVSRRRPQRLRADTASARNSPNLSQGSRNKTQRRTATDFTTSRGL